MRGKQPNPRVRLIRGAAIAALALAAAACSGNGSSGGGQVTTPPPMGAACDTFLEQFGLGFCQKYKAATNSDPTEVQASDIVAVDLTKEPIAVP